MLVQTKLFSPPATTPEMEQQQKMMKYMMIFMAFMFYKVPSGLGIYFITSSLWQISERLLLPKVTHVATLPVADDGPGRRAARTTAAAAAAAGGGNGAPAKPPGKFAQFWEKILAEASKNPTYRNLTAGAGAGARARPGKDRGRGRAAGGEDSVTSGPRSLCDSEPCFPSTRPIRSRRSPAPRGRGFAASCGSRGPRRGRSPWGASSPTSRPRCRPAPAPRRGGYGWRA